jgi:hypothetical protein
MKHYVFAVMVVCGCGGSEGGNGDAGGGTEPGGPEIVSLGVNRASLTGGGSIVFTATVTDPDGLADIAGGVFTTTDGSITVGAFQADLPGTYSFELTWSEVNEIEVIEFEAEATRRFRVTFRDNSNKTGWQDVDVKLSCEGMTACDGQCVDTQSNDDHCGRCHRACEVQPPDRGYCEAGDCRPNLSECVWWSDYPDCNAVCAAAGETCSGSPYCETQHTYSGLEDCKPFDRFGSGGSCDTPFPETYWARCCCTQTVP